jgi:hypothetical protein
VALRYLRREREEREDVFNVWNQMEIKRKKKVLSKTVNPIFIQK